MKDKLYLNNLLNICNQRGEIQKVKDEYPEKSLVEISFQCGKRGGHTAAAKADAEMVLPVAEKRSWQEQHTRAGDEVMAASLDIAGKITRKSDRSSLRAHP